MRDIETKDGHRQVEETTGKNMLYDQGGFHIKTLNISLMQAVQYVIL